MRVYFTRLLACLLTWRLRRLFTSRFGVRRALYGVVERFLGGKGFITGHVSPRKLKPLPDAWVDPFTGQQHTGGVFALLPLAKRRSAEYMSAALLLWMGRSSQAEFCQAVGSHSYTEGRPTAQSDPAHVPAEPEPDAADTAPEEMTEKEIVV